jgi:diguanylate cyclase (GGDEF)-like protein
MEESHARNADGDDERAANESGEDRDRTATRRDERAEADDRASEALDERAEARDAHAEDREQAVDGVDTGAGADRARALRDRRGAASDRARAADDRDAASADRARSARDRAASSIDELTGAHRREAGLVELEREVARAHRTQRPVALAFVDADHLKGTNDSLGHAAGDQRLRDTAASIRAHLRPYDLIVRFGGDEFLCALLDATKADAAERFALVTASLAATHQTSVTVGIAELEEGDSLEDLIGRADNAMYRERQKPGSAGVG